MIPLRLLYRTARHWLAFLSVISHALLGGSLLAAPPTDSSRLRIVIETDAGGDPDDEQSLVRFLLHASEWDVEGIIANRPMARDGENRNPERTGLGIVRAQVAAYGRVYPSLRLHDPRYPSPEQLQARTVPGYDTTDAGVELLLAALDSEDPRPVWYMDWGSDRGSATNNLRRALDRVLRDRGENGYARIKSRIRLLGHDAFGIHSTKPPAWKLWINPYEPEMDGRRWYHRFSALTSKAGGFDVTRDVLTGHGPLGALYPTNTTHWLKEGDSSTFLYLMPTGLSDPNQPTMGGWPGRYGLRTSPTNPPVYWANQLDTWQGTTHRDNTLKRWAVAIQNEFRARLDWCVQPYAAANHPPRIRLNGVEGTEVLHLHAHPGETLEFDASRSEDPDGQSIDWEWFVYPEAGTYPHAIALQNATTHRIEWRIPSDAAGHSLHLVVAGTDTGVPSLTRYRRAVIHVRDAESVRREIEPFSQPPAEWVSQTNSLPSPLAKPGGGRIQTRDEWASRRAAIHREWMDLMGPWPPLVAEPRVERLAETRRDGFQQRRVRVETAQGQTSEGWWLAPMGPGPFPAVLVVYYEPETSVGLNPRQTLRDFGLELARRGFVTLSIGTPGGNAFKPDIREARCQPLSYHAYVAANAWKALASDPAVDPKRIGIVGHSYGGKWALFAAALWEPFACVAVSDPGIVFDETRSSINYWEPWYLGLDPARTRKPGIPTPDNPRTGAYARMRELGRDLHEVHALIAPRPFLVSGGAEDPPKRWQSLQHALEVNRVLGYTNRVFMTNRAEHDPNEASNAALLAFFEHHLKFNPAP